MVERACVEAYLGINLSSDLKLVMGVEQGFPLQIIDVLFAKGLTRAEIADLIISIRALRYRRLHSGKLSCLQTEHALRIATALFASEKKFQDQTSALDWFRSPQEGLEGRTPISLLKSDAGGRVVKTMLDRIEHVAKL